MVLGDPCSCLRFLLFLAGLLGRGFHGALQGALERVELVGRLLKQEAGHKLLQVGGLLVVLPITEEEAEEEEEEEGQSVWEDGQPGFSASLRSPC